MSSKPPYFRLTRPDSKSTHFREEARIPLICKNAHFSEKSVSKSRYERAAGSGLDWFVKLSFAEKVLILRTMGSHHRQVAILVPDEKLNCFDFGQKKFQNKRRQLSSGTSRDT